MIKINVRGDAAGSGWKARSDICVSEAASGRPGRTVLLSKMAEALFIETLRRYMEQLPPEQIGWLAGARDPVVGTALALLHRKPSHPWTVAELATEAGVPARYLRERFTRFLGEPPLTYLARWRLQLAARKLQTTRQTISRSPPTSATNPRPHSIAHSSGSSAFRPPTIVRFLRGRDEGAFGDELAGPTCGRSARNLCPNRLKMRRTCIEHMLSALPPILAVKAYIRGRQVRAKSHTCQNDVA